MSVAKMTTGRHLYEISNKTALKRTESNLLTVLNTPKTVGAQTARLNKLHQLADQERQNSRILSKHVKSQSNLSKHTAAKRQ